MIIGIIGCGVVGESQAKLCEYLGHNVYRKDLKLDTSASIRFMKKECEIVFLCLPTPSNDKGIDMSAFEDVMPQLEGYKGTLVIKSTVLPGTCEKYSERYNLNIIHNPEFLTEKNARIDTVQPDKIVIGVDKVNISNPLIKLYDPFKVEVFVTNTITSELSKYASNYFLAMKVSFANEMYDLCNKMGANYETIKESLYADKRIGDTHLEATGLGWGGMCFPKDTVALLNYCKDIDFNPTLLKATIDRNTLYRGKVEKWFK